MTNDFNDLLRGVAPAPAQEEPFQAELRKLAEAIGQQYPGLTAQAVLEPVADFTSANQLVLRISVKDDSRNAWDALYFRPGPSGTISVLGGENIGGPVEFHTYLVGILQTGHLQRSLANLNEEAQAPVEGELRTSGPETLAAYDVVVRLTKAEYKRLRLSQGEMEIRARPATPPKIAPFEAGGLPYQYLTIDGSAWRLMAQPTRVEGGEILLKVVRSDEPPAVPKSTVTEVAPGLYCVRVLRPESEGGPISSEARWDQKRALYALDLTKRLLEETARYRQITEADILRILGNATQGVAQNYVDW